MNPKSETLCEALLLTPQYRDYVWGGGRLRPGFSPTAEAWIVYEHDQVAGGAHAGRTLAELANDFGPALLGERVVAQTGLRFPLLIKLLDCAQWLSLQVHPNDEQAVHLEGPGHFGKTEAWHMVEAAPGAKILCGLQPGTSPAALAQAVRDGTILDLMQHVPVKSGDSIFIPPGMIHALGPGLLIYEVQQTSDITYRVFDWNRPASEGRKLHIEQSLEVANPRLSGEVIPLPPLADGDHQVVISCEYFTLEVLACRTQPVALDTAQQSFHALTALHGRVQVEGPGWSQPLGRYETAVVPAACGAYRVVPQEGEARLLKSSAA